MASTADRIARLLPATSAGRRLALVALVDAAGTGVFLTGSIVFLTRVAGLGPAQIGLGMSAAGIIGLVSAVPIGILADRFGVRRGLIGLQLWRGCWFLAYAFVGGFPAFIVVACMLGLADKAVGPVNQAMVGAVVGTDDRVRTMATMRVVRNIGFSLGALAGTGAIGLDTTAAFRAIVFANAFSFFVATLLIARLRVISTPASARRGPLWSGLTSLRDGRYLALAGLNAVLVLHMTMLSVGIPLWILTHTSAPPQTTGMIIVVNTVLVVLLQVRVSRGCDDVMVAARRMRWAGVALAACCLLLASSAGAGAAGATALVLAAVVFLAAGEMLQSAGGWGISFELAPADQRAAYLSVFSLGSTVQSIAGPTMLTVAVVPHGAVGWLCLGAVLVVAGLVVPAAVARAATRLDGAARQPVTAG